MTSGSAPRKEAGHVGNTVLYRFAEFTFDPATGELSGGETVRLAPQPATVLSMLLESPGVLVTRTRLKARLWPDSVVDYDKGLNFCVREIRVALGDRAASPRFIETLPRRGYRFKGVVTRTSALSVPKPAAAIRRWWVAAALAAICALPTAATRTTSGAPAPAPDERARELAEMGGFLLTRGQDDDIERSVAFFRRSLAVDPGYARALAGLGSASLALSLFEEGEAALRRSIELDPRQWAPHVNLALHALYTNYDRTTARRHFERALSIAPRRAVVRHTYAWFLAIEGNLRAAMDEMREALRLDPVSPRVNGDVGRLFYLAGRHDEAVAQCRATAQLTPEVLRPRDCVVQALFEAGAIGHAAAEAAQIMAEFEVDAGESVVDAATPAAVLAQYWRWAADSVARLAERGEDSWVHSAAAWARLGEAGHALDALESAFRVRCPVLPQIGLDPAFKEMRTNARFRSLLQSVGAAAEPNLRSDGAGIAARPRAALDPR